jgi:mRNA interferase MazF
LCQITSNAYGDSRAVPLDDPDFVSGGLKVASYARPAKLFTAHERLIAKSVGRLRDDTFRRVVDAVVALLRMGIP